MTDAEMQQAAMQKALASLFRARTEEDRARLEAFNAENVAWRERRMGKRCPACGGRDA